MNFSREFVEKLASLGWSAILNPGPLILWFIKVVFGVTWQQWHNFI